MLIDCVDDTIVSAAADSTVKGSLSAVYVIYLLSAVYVIYLLFFHLTFRTLRIL